MTNIKDDWETPKCLFDKLNKQYNFSFDCCANNLNKKCRYYSDNFTNIKDISHNHICFINPPFSNADNMFKHFFKIVKKGVGIYRCDNFECKIWQDIILNNCDWVFIPKGRIFYSYNSKIIKNSRFPSAIFGIGVDPPYNINGVVLYKNGKQYN